MAAWTAPRRQWRRLSTPTWSRSGVRHWPIDDWPKRVKRDTCLTPFDFAMLSPLATLANEEDWRIANDKPANCEGRC